MQKQNYSGIKNLRELFQARQSKVNGEIFTSSQSNFLSQNKSRLAGSKAPMLQKLPSFKLTQKGLSPRSNGVSPVQNNSGLKSIKPSSIFVSINQKKDKDPQQTIVAQSGIYLKGGIEVSLPITFFQNTPQISRNNSITQNRKQEPVTQSERHVSLINQKGPQTLTSRKPNLEVNNMDQRLRNFLQITPSNLNLTKREPHSRQDSIFSPRNLERKVNEDPEGVTKNLFKFHFVVGKGGFGKVWKVEFKKTRAVYAMKEMSKAKILSKKSVHSVLNERVLLSQLHHPFLANIHQAFQDRNNLYLVMDLLTGGDLRYHLGKQKYFSETQTKFFIACIILALEYLHNNQIIHRDIKPENLVIDRKGYVRVTDLGIARILRPENNQDTSGTPGYMAPEVMCRQNHGIAVDYFAVGVIAYEFMLGKRPYVGKTRKDIRDAILSRQVSIKKQDIPIGWSVEAADFINKLLQRKPQQRLGFNGPEEIKDHPWFYQYPWVKLFKKEITSPFIPKQIEDNLDYQRQISSDHDSQDELIQQNATELRRNSIQNLFENYNFDPTFQLITKLTGSTTTTQIDNQKFKIE